MMSYSKFKSEKKTVSIWKKILNWFQETHSILFFMVMIFLVFFLIYIGSGSGNTTSSSSSYYHYTSSETSLPPIIKVSESDIVEIDYDYLVNNPDKYKNSDKYFRVAGKIDTVYKDYFYAIIFKTSSGKKLSVYTQEGCDLTKYDADMYVTLICKIESVSSTSIKMNMGYIEESGNKAEATYNRLKSEGDKLRTADQKAEKEKAKKAKKDYIASCKTYKYKDIARNPDKYFGKRAKFKGEVVQVIEGYYDTTLRVDVTKGKYGIYTDTMYVVYTPKSSSESRILEDDIITIYGELSGIETYETIMGSRVSIPRIDAEYITINN